MMPMKEKAGKGSALLLLAGKLGKGKPAPDGDEEAGAPEEKDSGKEMEQEMAGEELANAVASKDHKAVYDAVCSILDMHKGYSAGETETEE